MSIITEKTFYCGDECFVIRLPDGEIEYIPTCGAPYIDSREVEAILGSEDADL